MSTFNHVENVEYRTYNRCATFFNLLSDSGKEPALNYLRQFDENGKAELSEMFALITQVGIGEVKRRVIDGQPIVGGC